MKKRFVSALLCLVMVLTLMPLTASADGNPRVLLSGQAISTGTPYYVNGGSTSGTEPAVWNAWLEVQNGEYTLHLKDLELSGNEVPIQVVDIPTLKFDLKGNSVVNATNISDPISAVSCEGLVISGTGSLTLSAPDSYPLGHSDGNLSISDNFRFLTSFSYSGGDLQESSSLINDRQIRYIKIFHALVADPVITPASGRISGSTDISITCETQGATIRYTTDSAIGNSEADFTSQSGIEYTTPVSVTAPTTVWARAFKDGYATSDIVSADYSLPKRSSTDYYTLTFDANGGSELSSVRRSERVTIDLSEFTTTREGYDFTGWYADTDFQEKLTNLRLGKNTTIYAGWKQHKIVNPFEDVLGTDWFFDDAMFVYDKGLMKGVGDTSFAPATKTNRAMLVTMLHRLAGEPTVTGDSTFGDVPADSYYSKAVTWAKVNKVAEGVGDNIFAPDASLTRQQLVTMLYNYAVYMGYDVSVGEDTNILSYSDAFDVADWAVPAVQWACGAGILQGDGDKLMPQGEASRAELAAMVHRFIGSIS